jgi:serine/threonine-protein phosphatase 6 regulatory ankyrin repeat subunit B
MYSLKEWQDLLCEDDDAVELIKAASMGALSRVKQLISGGVAPDTQGSKGWTALRIAAVKGHARVAAELLRAGANVSGANVNGQTALHMAAAYGHAELVRLLLAGGADPDQPNNGGVTALMLASQNGYAPIVRMLLERNVAVNAQSSYGATALMLAAHNGHEQIVQMLLSGGADPTIVNTSLMHQGETASSIARRRGLRQIEELLDEAVAQRSFRAALSEAGRVPAPQSDS